MSVSPARPDEGTLRRLLTGTLTPEELAAVADYLEQYPEALDTLNALPAEDTLVSALRSGRDPEGDPSELQALLERLLEIPPPRPDATEELAAAGSAGSDTTGDTAADIDVDEVLRELLAAPQGPDERGRLAGYRVLRLLGRGGMGLVFEAEDIDLQRRVALKAMYPRAARNAAARQRFLREARAMAAIDHDHIVHVYQVGEERGVPYLAMPLLQGTTLEALLTAGTPLDPAQVVRIGRQIAEGLAAAHDRGLIHRDVKPSNVWLETGRGGRVKLLDFGLARLVSEEQGLTRAGTVVGTPAYMAPEQARGLAIDGRADLFGLGCVLYRMTTGRAPFTGSDTFAILTALATDTPPAPAAVNPTVPAALSALVMHLLEKDPARRPVSARAVAAALDRIDLTVPATPLPAAPLRHRPRAGHLVAAAMVLLAGGAALLAPVLVRLATPNGELVLKVDDPTLEVVVKQDGAVIHDRTKNRHFVLTAGRDGQVEFVDPETGVRVLTKTFTIERGRKTVVEATMHGLAAAKAPAEKESATTEPLSPTALVARPVKLPGVVSWTLETVGHRGAVTAVAFSLKQEWVASAGDDGAVRIWNARTAALHRVLVRHPERVDNLAWSPDGRLLASVSAGDGRIACVWQPDTGKRVRTLAAAGYAVAWSPDGKQLAIGEREAIRVFNVADWAEVRLLQAAAPVWRIGWSPDGKQLAAIVRYHSAVLRWDAAGQPLPPLSADADGLLALAWAPDARTLAAAGSGKKVWLWDAVGKLIHTAVAGDQVNALAWSPDGKQVASIGAPIQFWQAADGTKAATIPIGGQTLAWAGERLAVGNQEGTIVLVDPSGKTEHTIRGHQVVPTRAIASPDGKRLALTNWFAKIWDVEARALISCGDLAGNACAWSPDSATLAVSREEDTTLLDGKTGKLLQVLERGKPWGGLAWSADGHSLAVCGRDNSLRVHDVKGQRSLLDIAGLPNHVGQRHVVAWAPDGNTVAYSASAHVLHLIDVASGRRWTTGVDTRPVSAAVWSADGKMVVVGNEAGDVRLFDRAGKLVEQVRAGAAVDGLAWLSGGRSLACGLANHTVRVWDLPTGMLGQATPTLPWPTGATGGRLVSDFRGTLACWDVATGQRHGTLISLTNDRIVVLGPEGHWHSNGLAVEANLIYLVATDRGQELLTPAAFTRRFSFTNDPGRARLFPR